MNTKYQDLENLNYSVSDVDIKHYFDYPVNIIKYGEIRDYKNIEDLLDNPTFILIETENNYGHWVCIFLCEKDGINYFDSYGDSIDSIFTTKKLKLKNEQNIVKKQIGQDHMYLTQLLINAPFKVYYNDFQFQSENPIVSTCGRWCIYRVANSDLTADEFKSTVLRNEPAGIPKGREKRVTNDFALDLYVCKVI